MRKKSFYQTTKEVLWKRFKDITGLHIDADGYVTKLEENLLPGVTMEMFQGDLEGGSGNELGKKFRAIHSSSALAVNSFAPFKTNLGQLVLADKKGFTNIQFEKQCPTGLGGTPPNLDLIAESNTDIVAVESKFLEYLTPKKPEFAASYKRERLPQAEDIWLFLMDEIHKSQRQYLDAAQLVKHYLGLRNQEDYRGKNITLLYLFWEPVNWQDFEVFKQHRQEIKTFAERVKDSAVTFISQSYTELWDQWFQQGIFLKHLENLKKRYLVNFPSE